MVVQGSDDKLIYVDGRTWEEAHASGKDAKINLLQPIFKDGQLIKEQSLAEIRDILHGGKF